MPFYGFKEPPKQAVASKAKKLFGRETKAKVEGQRLKPDECKARQIPVGSYLVGVTITTPSGKQHVLTANLRDWRKAYSLLTIEVEKCYEASLHQLTEL